MKIVFFLASFLQPFLTTFDVKANLHDTTIACDSYACVQNRINIRDLEDDIYFKY